MKSVDRSVMRSVDRSLYRTHQKRTDQNRPDTTQTRHYPDTTQTVRAGCDKRQTLLSPHAREQRLTVGTKP